MNTPSTTQPQHPHVAVVGAGMAGITCACTLFQAGFQVTVFDKSRGLGGRMATRDSPFGSFDHGAQYFTARHPAFIQAVTARPDLCKRWSANTLCLLDEQGRVTAADHHPEAHWVPVPSMKSLVRGWAAPLTATGSLALQTRVTGLEFTSAPSKPWHVHTETDGNPGLVTGFDAVVLAMPAAQSQQVLSDSAQSADWADWVSQLGQVTVAPCWTLMLAFPQAMQPGLSALGPQWNAACSTHHRIAWLARESSKPGRDVIERWTVQASSDWSAQHLHDDDARVQAKLCQAFAEVTGIRASPAHVDSQRWLYAKTTHPLGQSHLWDVTRRLGVCGDWCLGHRVEDAYLSGLALALAMIRA